MESLFGERQEAVMEEDWVERGVGVMAGEVGVVMGGGVEATQVGKEEGGVEGVREEEVVTLEGVGVVQVVEAH